MTDSSLLAPDNTAVRVALWRALHVQVDASPHVFEDELGLALVEPDADWQQRPDMSAFTRPFRASFLARARYVEDLLEEQAARGASQYVILGRAEAPAPERLNSSGGSKSTSRNG